MQGRMAARAAAAAVFVLGLGACMAGGARAAPDRADSSRSCFYASNVRSWTAVDRSTVNLRVGVRDFYQLKLLGDCPNLDFPGRLGLGIEHRGRSWICSGLDATLIVPQPGGRSIPPLRCPVSSIRKLSPEEVAALPSRDRP